MLPIPSRSVPEISRAWVEALELSALAVKTAGTDATAGSLSILTAGNPGTPRDLFPNLSSPKGRVPVVSPIPPFPTTGTVPRHCGVPVIVRLLDLVNRTIVHYMILNCANEGLGTG